MVTPTLPQSIRRAMERLEAAVFEQTAEREAESNRRLAEVAECIKAGRNGGAVRVDRAGALKTAIEKAVAAALKAGKDAGAVRRCACEEIARHVMAEYGIIPTSSQVQSLVEAAFKFTPEAVQNAALDFLREPHDPRVTSAIAVVIARAAKSRRMEVVNERE